jgi:hypothetical protein
MSKNGEPSRDVGEPSRADVVAHCRNPLTGCWRPASVACDCACPGCSGGDPSPTPGAERVELPLAARAGSAIRSAPLDSPRALIRRVSRLRTPATSRTPKETSP